MLNSPNLNIKESLNTIETKNLKVLIAEDNPDAIFYLKKILSDLWFINKNISVEEDWITSLENYEKNMYDIILLDNDLPRLNGLDICRKIRDLKDSDNIFLYSANINISEEYLKVFDDIIFKNSSKDNIWKVFKTFFNNKYWINLVFSDKVEEEKSKVLLELNNLLWI